jgi:hypothetical protein
MPIARRGDEVWYGADQVEPKPEPDAPPLQVIKVVQGGTMAGARARR